MSNPFAGPMPAIIPFSGTTDASGNLTIKQSLRQSFWWAGKMVGEISGPGPAVATGPGGANWRVRVGAIPYGFSGGQRVEMGGLLVSPGDVVEVNVIGGPPNLNVVGSFIGSQGATMQDVAGSFIAIPNSVAVVPNPPPQLVTVAVETPPLNATTTKTYTMPPGTDALVITKQLGGNVTVLVTGLISGITYSASTAFLNLNTPVEVQIFDPRDWLASGVQVSYTTGSTGPPTILVQATQIPIVASSALAAILQQAPANISNINEAIGAAADSTFLISGVVNQTIYLFDLDLQQDVNPPGPDFRLVLRDTATPTPTDLHTMSTNQNFPWHKSFRGAKVGIGLGVRFHNFSSNATAIRGSLTWSQQ